MFISKAVCTCSKRLVGAYHLTFGTVKLTEGPFCFQHASEVKTKRRTRLSSLFSGPHFCCQDFRASLSHTAQHSPNFNHSGRRHLIAFPQPQQHNMPPKKKVERAATENISLGPQVREGAYLPGICNTQLIQSQVNSSLAWPASSRPSTIPSSMLPISG